MISTGRECPVRELCTGIVSEQNRVNIICRLCGQCRCDVIPIFSEEAHRKHVLLKIQTRLLIQISASDPLPKNACVNCLEKLDSLWDFFELCRKTQIRLRGMFIKQSIYSCEAFQALLYKPAFCLRPDTRLIRVRCVRSYPLTLECIQDRDERVTLQKVQGNIETSHPPCCSFNSITHHITQDTSDIASGNKRIKLEYVPLIKEEPVCLDENSHTELTSTITSLAGSREQYWNDNMEISAEASKNSNVNVRLDHQQESVTITNNLCLSEMVDSNVRRNMLVLQDCDIAEGRSTVSLSVKSSDHWKALSSDLSDSSAGQQGRLQNVLKRKPVIDKGVSLDSVNSSTVQNHCRKISAELSSNSNISVRSDHQQKSDTTVKQLGLDGTVRRKMSVLQDCDCGESIDGGSSASLSMKMSDHLRATSSELIDDSPEQQGKLQDVLQTKPVIDKQAPLDYINNSVIQEIRSSPVISISHGESLENVLLDKTDNWLASTRTAEGRYSPVRSFESDSQIERGGSLNGTRQVEERISMRNSLSHRNNQEALLSVCIDDCVSQQQINENPSGRSSSESINQSVNTGANNFQLDKVESSILRNLLCADDSLEKEGRVTLQKEGTQTHIRKSVSQEEIKSNNILEEKQKLSASDNTVSDKDTVNNFGKLHDDGGGGGDDDDDDDDDDESSDCDKSFSCHDCGNSFSCKNSLTDHIFKQHIRAGHMNVLCTTPATAVTLDSLDSNIKKLSSSNVGSAHNANTCDNVLQKPEKNNKSLLALGKPTEGAQASSCNVPSIDDIDCTVMYDSTSSNATHVKPVKTKLGLNVKLSETELKPATLDEARLLCKKYSEIICETSGNTPKINMINIKVELPSGNFYTGSHIINFSLFKPFIILNDSKYDCQLCKTTFHTRSSIVKHIGKHFNLLPYSCKYCDKRYTLQGSANQHIQIHCTGIICEQCGLKCSSRSCYATHMLRHDKPFTCHDCGERFSSKVRIRSHILKVHMKIRSCICKICGKAYFHESNVTAHMVFAHAERKIVCQYCGKMYFRNNMLKQHIKRWHT